MINFTRIAKMIDPKGFDRLFEKELPQHPTYEDAFEALNDEYRKATGKDRYSNYESYRKARERRIKYHIFYNFLQTRLLIVCTFVLKFVLTHKIKHTINEQSCT